MRVESDAQGSGGPGCCCVQSIEGAYRLGVSGPWQKKHNASPNLLSTCASQISAPRLISPNMASHLPIQAN